MTSGVAPTVLITSPSARRMYSYSYGIVGVVSQPRPQRAGVQVKGPVAVNTARPAAGYATVDARRIVQVDVISV